MAGTREREFIEAILADPDDDGLRGVYGDWLLEQGDERGAFVHAQLALAATPPTDEAWWERRRRVEAFLDRRGKTWARQTGKVGSVAWGIEPAHLVRRNWFERGLVERATFPNWTQFEKSFDAACRVTPLREVRINKWSDAGVEAFFQPKYQDRIRGIWLTWDGFDSACTRVPGFFERPHTEGLERLRLFDRMLRPDGWERLLACRLDSLHRLELVNTRSADVDLGDVLADLVEWPRLEQLEHLVVDAGHLDDAGAIRLARSPKVANLQSLSLSYNELGEAAFSALAESPHLSGVGNLGLAGSRPSTAGLAALANSPHLGRLRRLDLADSDLDEAGLLELATSKSLSGLHELRFARAGTDDDTIRALTGGSGLAQLRGLDLWRYTGSGAAVTEVVTSPKLERLRYVRIGTSDLSRDDLKALRERFPHTHGSARTGIFEFATEPDLVP